MTHFKDLMENYVRHSHNNKYYFIITKSCGYEFIVTAYKIQTLQELFRIISCEIMVADVKLSIIKNGDDIINNSQSIETFISSYYGALEIATKPPDPVAYRLWLKCGCNCKCSGCK